MLHEYECTLIPQNPKMKKQDGSINKHGQMPFDNELIIGDKHLFIEVNGFQHYKICEYTKLSSKQNHTTPIYELHKQQLYDRYKRYIALSNGYFYIAIPYWNIENNDNYKKIIDNKIKEILNIKQLKVS